MENYVQLPIPTWRLKPVLTLTLDIGMAKSGSSLVHSHKSHVLRLTPYVKARKSFHGVLPCLVMMYYQTNLDCKSFSISKDVVETIVAALTLNVAKWYSGWWWCTTILSLTDQRYCPGKHSLKFQNLHCDRNLDYSTATFSQDSPAYEHAPSN